MQRVIAFSLSGDGDIATLGVAVPQRLSQVTGPATAPCSCVYERGAISAGLNPPFEGPLCA